MSAGCWKPVSGYPNYEVSDLGQVRRDGAVLKPYDGGNGYLKVSLSHCGKVRKFAVHRLVTRAFHGEPANENMDAAHWNGDRHDNRAENLRWASRSENMADTRRLGRAAIGSGHGHAKLEEGDVLKIVELRRNGWKYRELAAHFGVNRYTIRDICVGRNWGHLTGLGPSSRAPSPIHAPTGALRRRQSTPLLR